MFKRILIIISLLGTPAMMLAQARSTAERAGDLQIGGGISNANLDYGQNRVNGPAIYVDFDFYRHFGIEGEFHFLKNNETNSYEKTYEIGGRYSRVYRNRYQPYIKILYGRGVFNFTRDKVTVANLAYNMFAGGGGLDYRLLPYLNLRADFEYQSWLSFNNDPNVSAPRSGGLTPSMITIGAAYRFPAGKLSQH